MTSTSAPGPAITLEQLTALNQEIAALARAGVPLNYGLLHLGRDLPGRLGRLANQVGERLESGQPLGEALRAVPQMPPAYAAIVAAGVRSGRLAVALDDMATLIRRVGEMQRLMYLALLYPLLVLFLALILFSFTLLKCFPIVQEFYDSVSPDGRALFVLQWLAEVQSYWLPAVVLTVVLGLAVWIVRQRRALTGVESAGGRRRWRNRATIGNVIYSGRLAVLTETLATLIEHGVPLPESLRLAADASGDRGLRDAGHQWAQRLEAGETQASCGPLPGAPRMLGLVLASGTSPERLGTTLRRMGQSYRQEAAWMSRWVAVYLPVTLSVLIGGTATIAYALSVIWPFASVLWELAAPNVR
ncbi:MAG: type II secretion system F family protein [Pirellulaceae bacterium]|nr:type II secretion system F family protein [Pirellulaceae bacterium]